MKKKFFLITVLMALLMVSVSLAALAAPSDENPYKNQYAKEAQALRKQGTATIVYQFMTREKTPLPGVIMLYNTTKEKGIEAVADENGIVKFEVKASELYYAHHVIYNREILPIQGSAQISNIEKLDVRKGTVLWNCVVQYGKQAFMSYRGN